MKKYINHLAIILISITYLSCQDVSDVDVPEEPPRLVIESSIDWEKGTTGSEQIIKLSTSTPYFEIFSNTMVTGASVKVTTSRITRTRPQFHNWSADVLIQYDTTQAHESDVIRWMETAGRIIGIGDWRPEKSGIFGRFSVKVIESQ